MNLPSLDLSQVRILVVDDNRNMRLILKEVLRALQVRHVQEATDGADALQIMRSWVPDIVLTDWMMKPLDGVELTQFIRTAPDSPNPFMPVIMISAYTEQMRVEKARDSGVNEFMTKPISVYGLYRRIVECVLRPRPFIKTKGYFGPDRQRRDPEKYSGPERRKKDKLHHQAPDAERAVASLLDRVNQSMERPKFSRY